MKRYEQANLQILFDLFSWKKRAGEIIRFEIKERGYCWVVSFISHDVTALYEHIFASFTGDSHESLYRWALSTLSDFTISFDKSAVSFQVPVQVSNEVATPTFL
jgi:hypothetical protein